MLLLGWRGALVFVGLLGLPVAAAILWQSRILIDQARRPQAARPETVAALGCCSVIDAGRPELVLVVVAALLLLSLSCAGGARVGFRRAPMPVAAE
jgi:FSR family fosmidomycin resistance protein-like MFS transporter